MCGLRHQTPLKNGCRNTAVIVGTTAMLVGLALAHATPGVAPRSCPLDAIPIAPSASIQAAVDAAPTGASFCLKNGIHRLQVVRPKSGQRFFGEGRTILDGSEPIATFARKNNIFVANIVNADSWRPHGVCAKAAPGCDLPQNLFLDGRPLKPVLSKHDVAPGRFYFDLAAKRLYFADDPTGRNVEVAVAPFAFSGPATGVLISNLTIQKYASVPQHGAIEAGQGWVVENCEVRLNTSVGILTKAGARVSECNVHHNGQIGIGGNGHAIAIVDNEVWANNTRGFDFGWEAGGIKIALGSDIIMRGNRVHDNLGPGLWCDGECRNVLYSGNTVERNQGAGIYHEISHSAVIRDNFLVHNGLANGWYWGSQIIVSASEGVDVEHNRLVVSPGKCGIMLIDQGRNDGPHGTIVPHKTRNNTVRFNDTTFEGDSCAGGVSDVARGNENYSIIENGNNRFDYNTYRIPHFRGKYMFAWGHAETDWNGARRLGFEPHGRLIRY